MANYPLDAERGNKMTADGLLRVVVDCEATNLASTDTVELFEIDQDVYIEWCAYKVLTREGGAGTFDIGTAGTAGNADGLVDGGNANATTPVATLGNGVWAVQTAGGVIVTAESKIIFTANAALDACRVGVVLKTTPLVF